MGIKEQKDTITINGKTVGVIVILLLLLVSTLGIFLSSNEHDSSSTAQNYGGSKAGIITSEENSGGGNIPENCRLPVGQDVSSWKEHLGHHSETKDCLKYFN